MGIAVIVLDDAEMWRNFQSNTSVSTIDVSHKGFPHLDAGNLGVLIFVFQPIANCTFTFLIEHARDVEFHLAIVAKVISKLFRNTISLDLPICLHTNQHADI